MSSEFCLRWNNHRPNLVSVFKELLQHEVLVDVTLAAEGQFIHAHKLVLSACSLYFKELFAGNPCQHPIVILKDFRLADLKTVVDFIYQGEVNVKQERLPHVLKAAESLRIKGLAENPHSFEEFQPTTAASQHNAPGTPRLGSQASSLQQSSSLSDSREQSLSLEGEEGDNNGPAAVHSPPIKRRRLGHYDDHDTQHDGSTDSVRVKEEPSGPAGAATAGDDRQGTAGDVHQGYRGRDPSLLLVQGGGISPSEGSSGGGGQGVGECSSPVPPDPATGGSSPTPPPSLPATPSLSITNATTNNGDSNSSSGGGGGAAAALTPPDSAALLPHPNAGAVGWTLSPWLASVWPVLALRQQQQQQQQQQQHHHHQQPPPPPPPPPPQSPQHSLHHRLPPGFLHPPTPNTPPTSLAGTHSKIKAERSSRGFWPGGSREPSPGSGANTPPGVSLAGLDQMSLVTALGKELSPQMVLALQAVATRRESYSSAAKLFSVSVTTLWRYAKKLNLSDSLKASTAATNVATTTTTFIP